MKRNFPICVATLASLLLVLVVIGWYASENFSGRIGRRTMELGNAIVWPGRITDVLVSGTLGGFGGWCSGVIRIIVSWMVWGSPLVIALLLKAPRNQPTEREKS